MNMKRSLIYVVLTITLLIDSNLFVNNGWSAGGEIISFLARRDEARPIIFIDIQGEILQTLMTAPGELSAFTWSPNGRSIAYGSRQTGNPDIHLMDVDSNTHRQLTFHWSRDLWPSWSLDGKWIAFVSERAGAMDLYRMNVDGKSVRQLTDQGGCSGAAWSPDSQWIAFASAPGGGGYSLFVMDAMGRELRQIVGNVAFPGCTWSPDGKQIAFTSYDAEGGMQIFRIDAGGRNRHQLTGFNQGIRIYAPAWSPSGAWIAYILAEEPFKPVPIEQIFANAVISVVDTAGGGHGKSFEATRGLVSGPFIEWAPKRFLSVAPNPEKRMTFWGRLKQSEK